MPADEGQGALRNVGQEKKQAGLPDCRHSQTKGLVGPGRTERSADCITVYSSVQLTVQQCTTEYR